MINKSKLLPAGVIALSLLYSTPKTFSNPLLQLNIVGETSDADPTIEQSLLDQAYLPFRTF